MVPTLTSMNFYEQLATFPRVMHRIRTLLAPRR
jgi:hypothetical protein